MQQHITPEQVRRAVSEYNELYEADERELYKTSRRALADLLLGIPSDSVLHFTREVNRWGRTRTSREVWSYAKAALASLPWDETRDLRTQFSVERADYVVDLCEQLVNGICERGGRRREYSYASKMLHWLWPEQVPVNDTFVRGEWLGLEDQGRSAYREIVLWIFEQANQLKAVQSEIVGQFEPKTPLRAIDKTLWWIVAQSRK